MVFALKIKMFHNSDQSKTLQDPLITPLCSYSVVLKKLCDETEIIES